MSISEVAQLRQHIEEELIAMRSGLLGLAAVAKHDFIHAKMDRVGVHIDALAQQVGEEQAHHISCQVYMQVLEGNTHA